MIKVLPVTERETLKEIFEDSGCEFNDNSGCVVAADGTEILGRCLYYIDDESIKIIDVRPIDDIMLADGILRSALHVADYRGITDAFYLNSAPEQLFKSLDFIKSAADKSLKIEKLHESCCSCQKN